MGLEKRRLTEDRRLRKVNDRRAVQRTEHTAVRDGEGATRHVLQRELPVARLQVTSTSTSKSTVTHAPRCTVRFILTAT